LPKGNETAANVRAHAGSGIVRQQVAPFGVIAQALTNEATPLLLHAFFVRQPMDSSVAAHFRQRHFGHSETGRVEVFGRWKSYQAIRQRWQKVALVKLRESRKGSVGHRNDGAVPQNLIANAETVKQPTKLLVPLPRMRFLVFAKEHQVGLNRRKEGFLLRGMDAKQSSATLGDAFTQRLQGEKEKRTQVIAVLLLVEIIQHEQRDDFVASVGVLP
jgi:hypothetical protein